MINIRARGEREDSSDLTSLIDVVFILLAPRVLLC